MSSFHHWIWKYKEYVTDSTWTVLGLYLDRYCHSVYGPGEEGKSSKDFDLDEVMHPQLFFMSFLETYLLADLCDTEVEEILGKFKNDEADLTETFDKITDIIRDKKKIINAARVMRKLDEDEVRKFLNILFRIYKFDCSDSVEMIEKFHTWFEMCAWQYSMAKKGKDTRFAEELKAFFITAKETGHKKTPLDVMYFCLDYLTRHEEDDVSIDLFSVAEKYAQMQTAITEKVLGQDSAVKKFLQGLFNGQVKKREGNKAPEATFLFVGPPGVGKTYLAQTAAEISGRPFKIFSMGEYANESSFHGLIGFESTWKSATEGVLTSFVSEKKNAILIFDEIEKAHQTTIHLFLSILEGGYLTDLFTNEDVDFTDTIVIFTTNAGREFYEEKRDMALSSLPEATLMNALRKDVDKSGTPKLPSEILSRMGKGRVIAFDHMSPAKLIPIIKKGMESGAEDVGRTMNVKCDYDESLLPYLFLFHMGSQLDARVAAARSENFIIDSVYRVAEQLNSHRKKGKNNKENTDIRISFDIEVNRVADDLAIPDEVPEILVVCNQTDLNKLKSKKKNKYKLNHVYAEKDDSDFATYISGQLKKKNIAAILIDPFMREKKSKKNLGGLNNLDTMGNRVIDWLDTQKAVPPVYCLELNKDKKIDFSDYEDLFERGVRGVLPVCEAETQEKREDMIESLAYELFLNDKLEMLQSRGKALDFSIDSRLEQKDNEELITICIHDFNLVRNMDTEATEMFVDESVLAGEKFDDVIGGESAKEELRKFIRFIKDPDLYKQSGQQISKGILMYGPPGSGKTKLARAMASEADCPFISTTGTQFIRGEKNMTDVFRVARKYAPCILFIDEIESFALDPSIGRSYPEITKQLMTEMDGFEKKDKPVFVIAATNASKAPNLGERNVFLDGPLMRRFSKSVYMKWPDRKERIAFVKMIRKRQADKQYNFNLLTDADIADFADLTAGHSLAQLDTVLQQVTGRAAESDEQPTKAMLFNCFEEFVYGEEHEYSKDHIRRTAIHEAGHAFMGFYCDEKSNGRFAPEYATIIARGGYLGLVRQQIDETRTGYSKEELLKLIRIKLAGRAAEMEFTLHEEEGLTTGASNDLETATDIVDDMLRSYGMEEGFLATLPRDVILHSDLAKEYYETLNRILKRELSETRKIIRENRKKVQALADALLDRSRLDMDEMKKIIEKTK